MFICFFHRKNTIDGKQFQTILSIHCFFLLPVSTLRADSRAISSLNLVEIKSKSLNTPLSVSLYAQPAVPSREGMNLINLTAYPTAFGGFLSAFKK
jgi:hypothetical protein